MRTDTERLDFLETLSWTAYKSRDLENDKLLPYTVFVNEDDKPGRRGILRNTFREAIDKAMEEIKVKP